MGLGRWNNEATLLAGRDGFLKTQKTMITPQKTFPADGWGPLATVVRLRRFECIARRTPWLKGRNFRRRAMYSPLT